MNSRGDCPSCGERYSINVHFGGRCSRCGHYEGPVIIPRMTGAPAEAPKPSGPFTVMDWRGLPRIEGPWKLGT